jgi:hypothetical protein
MPARNTPTCPAAVPLCGTKAEVTVPSLDDWEKEWERAENVESGKRKVEMPQPKLLPVDFRLPSAAVAQSN